MEKIKTISENTDEQLQEATPVTEVPVDSEAKEEVKEEVPAETTTTTKKKKSAKKTVASEPATISTLTPDGVSVGDTVSDGEKDFTPQLVSDETKRSAKFLPKNYTLIDYLVLLALGGYTPSDIIAVYCFFKAIKENFKVKYIKQYHDNLGGFLLDKKAIYTEADAKLINYIFNKTFKDAVIKLCKYEYGMTYETFENVLKAITGGFTKVSKELAKLVEDKTIEVAEIEEGNPAEIKQEDDKVLSLSGGDKPVEKALRVSAKNAVVLNDVTAKSASISVIGQNSATVNNFCTEGEVKKETCHNQLYVDSSKVVTINGGTFNAKGYNVIEMGFENNAPLPELVNITGVRVTGENSNNIILIAGLQDNAVVNITDCEVDTCSNFFRYSNKENKSGVTINIKDCIVHKWETENEEEAGMIDLEDYTSKNENEENNNLFGPDKVTINIINCIGPDGKKITGTPAEVCGVKGEKQLIFIYRHGSKSHLEYDETKWPTINIM